MPEPENGGTPEETSAGFVRPGAARGMLAGVMLALTSIALVVWGAVFINLLLNLRLVPRLVGGAGPRTGAAVSVIIPARDEQDKIERTVRAFLAQDYGPIEIVVVNDRSTDATGAILGTIAREDARLVVVDGEPPPPGWLGKPWALHQGQQRARGELLLFVDADLDYAPGAVGALVGAIESSRADMVAVLPRVEMTGFWEQVTMPNLALTAIGAMPTWLANRTRFPRLGIGGGIGMLMRRTAYAAAGGHLTLRSAIVDDVGLAQALRRAGSRTIVVVADELVRIRLYHGLRAIIHGYTKNMFAVAGRSYVAVAVVLALTVVVHVLPFAGALAGHRPSLAAVALIIIVRVTLAARFHYSIASAVFTHPLMMAIWCWILLRSMWLTGVRNQLHWRGRLYEASASSNFGGPG
jgi:chlorobactene glucosyltransferase